MANVTPHALDHGVGEDHLNLCEKASDAVLDEDGTDLGIDVLDARVRDELRVAQVAHRASRCVAHDVGGPRRGELSGEPPGEDPAGKIVDDRVEVQACAIEQPDDRHVHVPDRVGALGADADARFGGIDAPAVGPS